MTTKIVGETPLLYGMLIEMPGPQELVRAAHQVHDAGYRHTDAYSPMPIHGLAEALGMRTTRLPLLILAGGLLGCTAGFALQYWVSVHAYPLNIGGRPLNSWPAFIPVSFEMTILTASLFGILGMLALNGLPRPHHPLFAHPDFARASQSGFFLAIEATDPQFDQLRQGDFLESLGAVQITEVPRTA